MQSFYSGAWVNFATWLLPSISFHGTNSCACILSLSKRNQSRISKRISLCGYCCSEKVNYQLTACLLSSCVCLSVKPDSFVRKRDNPATTLERELLDVFLLFHNVSQSRYIKISTQGGTIEGREKHINRYNVFFFILIALFPGGTHQLFDRQGVGMGMTTGQPAKQDQTREVLQQQQQQKHIHLSRRNAGRKNTHNNSTTSYLDRVTKSLLCRSWRNQEGTHTTQPID